MKVAGLARDVVVEEILRLSMIVFGVWEMLCPHLYCVFLLDFLTGCVDVSYLCLFLCRRSVDFAALLTRPLAYSPDFFYHRSPCLDRSGRSGESDVFLYCRAAFSCQLRLLKPF